jgi:putative phosphoesterase
MFAAPTIRTRLNALLAEVEGVRAAHDIESIHRMRVASRRLRTALDLFPDLVKPKWNRELKHLTQALGAARDLDVQIDLVQQALTKVPERRFRPGLQRLLLRLTQRRERQQAKVIKALDQFEASNVSGNLIQALALAPEAAATVSEGAGGQGSGGAAPLPAELYSRAHLALAGQIKEALAFDQAIHDPAHVSELHQLRIVCKHLRYALEVFAPLYVGAIRVRTIQAKGSPSGESPLPESPLQPYIAIIKTFQEILGDIHDCDVWIDLLPRFSADEQQRIRDYFGHDRPLKQFEPGLTYLLQERQYHRHVRYNEFLDLWIAHREADTWGNLVRLTEPVPETLVPAPPPLPDPACIALIGDIHANLPALEAILAHAHKHAATAIWNVGDFVGYGPYPDEVVRLMQAEKALSISGNYDLKVLQVKEKKEKWKKTKRPEKLLAFEWAFNHLSKESRRYLQALPQEQRFTVHGKRVLLTHGSPDSNEEPLTPDTPLKRLREISQMAAADLIITGHSHQAFTKTVDGVLFINTGSVGRPDDGDPRACYALLKLGSDAVEVKHYRVKYDTEKIAAAVREYGLPDSFARIFLHGRSLDDLVVEE